MSPVTDKIDPKPTTTASEKLHRRMSAVDFDEGYYYAAELKEFTRELGFKVSNFRKIELENLIRKPLTIGILPKHRPVMPRKAGATRDKLTADTLIVNYVGD
ncbi:MAG: hypothetical protein HN984_11155 [Marinovum sp.]|jgi:hypothetical protein|nr:hypothetical protein [Marinovum sp.]